MTKVLVIDTETTGLAPMHEKQIITPLLFLNEWDKCRIVEIAWILYEDGVPIKKESFMIKPNAFTIPESASKIHGITQQEANLKGEDFELVLSILRSDVLIADYIVAHNMEFDYHVILSEWYRYDPFTINIWKNTKRKCTMKDYLANPKDKWPRLKDLYYKCFNKYPALNHRALSDATACAEIYFYHCT